MESKTEEASRTVVEGQAEAAGNDKAAAAEGPPDPREAEIERLRAREEDLLRALAELSNAQRRRKQEMEQSLRHARESLIRDLLPVLDDFERAMGAIPGGDDDPIRAGVALVRDRLARLLEREGLEPIQSQGEPFDPTLHDAIATMPAPEGVAPNTVLEVAQAGYRLHDRVLRHAKVVVAADAGEAPL
ncbi:MAG TPA: nucleotide exchange factor GrpE [Candidatus Eisenbacteria bacterium]